MSNEKQFLPFLDGVRGISILSVFLFHALGVSFGYSELPWRGLFRDFNASWSFLAVYPLAYGFAGVASFFYLSGFCIHLSYRRGQRHGWISFFNRRFFRIIPAYLAALLFLLYVWPWINKQDSDWKRWQLVTHALCVHNFNAETCFAVNPSFWSIAVEVQLYLIYPVLILIAGRYGWRAAILSTAAAEVTIRAFESFSAFSGSQLPHGVLFSPFGYWLSWTLGAYSAECFYCGRESELSRVRLDVMTVVAFLLPLFRPTAPFAFLAFSLATGVWINQMILGRVWTRPPYVLKIFWQHLCQLGIISYSFYLIHQPLVFLTKGIVLRVVPSMVDVPLMLLLICLGWYPIVYLASFVSFRLLEQPFIKVGHFVGQRLSSGAMKA